MTFSHVRKRLEHPTIWKLEQSREEVTSLEWEWWLAQQTEEPLQRCFQLVNWTGYDQENLGPNKQGVGGGGGRVGEGQPKAWILMEPSWNPQGRGFGTSVRRTAG
jgi:hypothetical protein